MAQEFWARHSRDSGRQALAAAERYIFERDFIENRGRTLGDGAAKRYAAQQASARVTGVQTETHRYGPFDGVFFYENPPVPSYRPDEPHPQTTHWRSSVPSPELPVHAGGSEASRICECLGYYEDDGYDHLYETQTRAAHHCQDKHYDHSNAHAVQDARYEQPVDHLVGDIAGWVEAQSARMQTTGVVQVVRLCDSGSEALDQGNGETPGNLNGEEQSGGYGEALGAPRHGSQMYEYSEDWESVTFFADDEPEDVEVDDDSLDGRWEDRRRSVERFL